MDPACKQSKVRRARLLICALYSTVQSQFYVDVNLLSFISLNPAHIYGADAGITQILFLVEVWTAAIDELVYLIKKHVIVEDAIKVPDVAQF